MYGLVEYALIRQQLHERNKAQRTPSEFAYAVTQPAPGRKGRHLRRMKRLAASRRALRRYLGLGA